MKILHATLLLLTLVPTATLRAADPPKPIDLIRLVDISRDPINGRWSVVDNRLLCKEARGARIELPYVPPAEYDFRVTFETTGDKAEVSSICPAPQPRFPDTQFSWIVGGWSNTICGFGFVHSQDANANASTIRSTQWITPIEKHVSLLKVRSNRIEGYLDDKLVSSLTTDYRDIKLDPNLKLQQNNALGLLVRGTAITIDAAELIEITGHGSPVHNAQTAAPTLAAPGSAPLAALAPAGATTTPAHPKTELPTPEEIKSLFAAANYRDALAADIRLLEFKASPAPAFDRTAMENLRIDCLLQLKQTSTASSLLEARRKMAENAGDSKTAAVSASLAFLIRRSPTGTYTPVTGSDRTPIDILTPANRPKAITALFADEFAAFQKKASTLAAGNSVTPIVDAGPMVATLRYLEQAAAGSTSQTAGVVSTLVAAFNRIVKDALSAGDTKVAAISTHAARLVPDNPTITYRRVDRTIAHSHRAGLDASETQALQSIIADCQSITRTATTLGTGLADPSGPAASATGAASLQKRAEAVLAGSDDPGSSAPKDRLQRR